ncbi:MAG: sulfotransferase [Rubrobacter sp.]|nr:sulfotransferase [Rubrobacter sp.]
MSAGVKVLYIAGLGRSGSTILANGLGQVDGFFSAGELNFIWKHNLIGNRLCGCGAPFHSCPVWAGILDEAFGGPDGVDAHEMVRLQHQGTRTRHVPLMLVPRGRYLLRERLGKLLGSTGRLYGAMAAETGSRVIVDSSKEPAYGYALGMAPGIDLRVLHLVRDPRAAAYSWLKRKRQPDSEEIEYMHRMSAPKSAALWDAWNAAAEVLWRREPGRYLRLRYEDFVRSPRESFQRILRLLGEEGAEVPMEGERGVKLGVSHTVSGNPNRFDTGTVELRPDREWTERMEPRDRLAVTALTFPLLRRYGYPAGSAAE